MKRKRVINIVKWTWLFAVLAGAGWYVYRNYQEISQYLHDLSPWRLLLSFFFLCIGKFFVSDLTRLSLKKVDCFLPYKDALTISAVTQLGKYLPGGIWHFAGKFSMYKLKDLSAKAASKAMVMETFWLFSSAALIGLTALFFTGNQFFCDRMGILCDPVKMKNLILPLVFLWGIGSFLFEKIFFKDKKIVPADFFLSTAEQILIWTFFGLSYWLIFPPNWEFVIGIIGAFSVSWLGGYVAFFAPGGIGVRELLLTLLLGSSFLQADISIYATIHRLLWVIVELLLGVVSVILFGMPQTEAEVDPD